MKQLNKQANFVSAVVYCCNDSNAVGKFIEGLHMALDAYFAKYEIIVVDDESSDGCIQEVRDYVKNKGGLVISVLRMSYYQGLEASMNAGIDLAIGDFIYEFDTCHQDFNWDLLYTIYEHSLTGYDIVNARPEETSSLISKLSFEIFNRYAHLPYKIGNESFKIVSRRAINRVNSITQAIPLRKAAYASSGLKIDAISYKPNKSNGRNAYKWKTGRIKSLVLFTDIIYRITLGLSIVMFVLSFSFAIYAFIYRFLHSSIEGWATAVIFSSVSSCGLFAILAMVIKYLQTIIELTFRKKSYIFESIEKLQ